ncbi:SDR family NAD(P)-dependent oxidoreductase [Streptomyces sp. NRRL F-5135]|uniref:SDR family NAD(P)-dependent oxidoreductase n=1 Tax=Streptomyces sp. NRRL F-5135 TaxID=1463858 RepID=UPI0004C5EABE|nr:SDR family NAD(P)-dependent oxidoreductase [Streptomyces sp. NRRL F-5135]
MSEQDFRDKVVLVTGAGSGIGAATAARFGAAGATVVVADIDAESAAGVAGTIQAAGGTAWPTRVDVSDPEAVDALVESVMERYGALHVAVNNAGIINRFAPLAELSTEEFRRVLDVNLVGVFACMRAEIRAMLTLGGGVIVNLTSTSGLKGAPALAAHTATKHGIIGLTRVAALEYGEAGIRVVAVAPNGVDTPALRSGPDGWEQAVIGAQAVKRLGRPEEIAELIHFLSGDSAGFITGSTHVIDGGYLA